MTPKTIEARIRDAAAFAEAGSDLEDPPHGDHLFEGAVWIKSNAKLASHAGELLEALKSLMEDYNNTYQECTDWGQYGKHPATPAWRRASRLVRKLEQ